MKHDTQTVYYYELLNGKGDLIVDTKIYFSSAFAAIARGRSLKREHRAGRVRIENADNYKTYWI